VKSEEKHTYWKNVKTAAHIQIFLHILGCRIQGVSEEIVRVNILGGSSMDYFE
jgi:hypothetical protein